MTRWILSVPVWGEEHVALFCAAALPALQRAAHALAAAHGVDVRLLVHTDQLERVRASTDLVVEDRVVPAGARCFDSMSQAHRQALAAGLRGDVVVLLTSGAVVSEESLVYCADVLANSSLRAVMCAVPRVLQEGVIPDTADAAAFMAWAWGNRHPMVRECTWPDGRSRDLSRAFFVAGESVVTRQALPHPLAVRIDGRSLHFTPTVDANLFHCFDPSEMHVALDCERLAVIKLSPADRGYETVPDSMIQRADAGQLVIGDAHQRWCLWHRICLVGPPPSDVCGDGLFVGAVRER